MKHPEKIGDWQVVKSLQGERTYLVRKYENQPLHVLKTLMKDPRNIIEHRRTMENEVKALQRLTDHSGIITLVDYDKKYRWHVTEYCEGGQFNMGKLEDWPTEELNNVGEKIWELYKAFGYAHSQGILIGQDFEIFLDKDHNFIIGDLEHCSVWDNHHLNTTADLQQISFTLNGISRRAIGEYERRTKEKGQQEQVMRSLEQAPPSAPRRLAK